MFICVVSAEIFCGGLLLEAGGEAEEAIKW